jgi:hypothetical protein
MSSAVIVRFSVLDEKQAGSGDQAELISITFIPGGRRGVDWENCVVRVQGDGIWSCAYGDSVSFMQVLYDIVTLSGGDDLDQPETSDTIDERTRELC